MRWFLLLIVALGVLFIYALCYAQTTTPPAPQIVTDPTQVFIQGVGASSILATLLALLAKGLPLLARAVIAAEKIAANTAATQHGVSQLLETDRRHLKSRRRWWHVR